MSKLGGHVLIRMTTERPPSPTVEHYEFWAMEVIPRSFQ